MAEVFLLVGGNLGDRISNLNKVYDLVSEMVGIVLESSSIIETEPWGFDHEKDFLNQVFKVNTHLSPEELLLITQDIENNLGRIKNRAGYEARTMDIDILFYDDEVINKTSLVIPHPRMHLRRFTLYPLNEIAGSFIHPILKKSIGELLDTCNDNAKLKIIK